MESAAEHKHAIGADDREGRMGDIDDIEQAEGDRGADAERRIEAAQQQSGDHGIGEKRVGYRHDAILCPTVTVRSNRLAPLCAARADPVAGISLMSGVLERQQFAAFVLGRRHDDHFVRALELLDVVAFDVLELRREHARLSPFAAFAEFHVADQMS